VAIDLTKDFDKQVLRRISNLEEVIKDISEIIKETEKLKEDIEELESELIQDNNKISASYPVTFFNFKEIYTFLKLLKNVSAIEWSKL
jgi:translation initiation factor 2B subunit (eIF-2B alpha/beta/delta family)